MKPLAAVLSALLLLALPLAARAGCNRVRACAVVVATPAYVAPTVAVVAAYPAPTYYGASYQPDAALIELLREQAARLDGIETVLRGQAVTPPARALIPDPSPMPPAVPDAALAPVRSVWTSCIRCHDGAAAQWEGHVLFAAGRPTAWSCAVMLEIVDRVTRPVGAKGAMPKGAELSAEDAEAILTEVKRLAATAGK
jgi:hypothetical protein